jgi:hypothetical protein
MAKKIVVTFTAKFVGTIEVPDDATPQDIRDAAMDVDIPESGQSSYEANSFEIINIEDENGNPVNTIDDYEPDFEDEPDHRLD